MPIVMYVSVYRDVKLLVFFFRSQPVLPFCHTICYRYIFFKKLKCFFTSIKFQNNGPVLLFKVIFVKIMVPFCLLQWMTVDWNLKKLGQLEVFQLHVYACKNHQKRKSLSTSSLLSEIMTQVCALNLYWLFSPFLLFCRKK